jgi:hypothetical protein
VTERRRAYEPLHDAQKERDDRSSFTESNIAAGSRLNTPPDK